jgi:hypothetical protein
MARADSVKNSKKKPIKQYDHKGKKREQPARRPGDAGDGLC